RGRLRDRHRRSRERTVTTEAPDTVAPTGRRPSLWRQRDFLLLWSGQIVSVLGARATLAAMPLLVLAISHSPARAGIVAAAAMLPQLLCQLPAGVLVDRWDRRIVMVVADTGRVLALASVPVALLVGHLTLGQLIIVSFVDGIGLVLFGLAENSSLPRVVPVTLLPAAIAQNEAKDRGAALVGKPLGGLLFEVGRAVPFLVDAVSYLLSLVSVLLIRTDLRPPRDPAPQRVWRQAAEGLRWLWRQRFLRATVLLVGMSNMVFQAQTLTVVVVARHQHASPATIGLVLGMSGGGGLLGALLAGKLHRLLPPRLVVIGVNWYWVVITPLLALAPSPPLVGLVAAASAFVGPLWNVVLGTYELTLVPPELLGRVQSAGMTVAWGVLPLGSLLGGFLLQSVGTTGTVLAMTGMLLVAAVAATVSPSVRHAPALPA
ncbi:MAG: MFS transporter, partial [Actinocatenispora sp.]